MAASPSFIAIFYIPQKAIALASKIEKDVSFGLHGLHLAFGDNASAPFGAIDGSRGRRIGLERHHPFPLEVLLELLAQNLLVVRVFVRKAAKFVSTQIANDLVVRWREGHGHAREVIVEMLGASRIELCILFVH